MAHVGSQLLLINTQTVVGYTLTPLKAQQLIQRNSIIMTEYF